MPLDGSGLERHRGDLEVLNYRSLRSLVRALRRCRRRNVSITAKATYRRYIGEGRPPNWTPNDDDRRLVIKDLEPRLPIHGFTLSNVTLRRLYTRGRYEYVEATVACT